MKHNSATKISIIKNASLFSGFNEREICALADISVRKECPKDAVLIREGEKQTSLCLLMSGKAHAASIGPDGKKIIYNTFIPGDYFGEMSFVDKEPRCATVEMTEPGEVLMIHGDKLRDMMCSNADFMFTLTKGLLQKLRKATRQIEDLEFVIGHQVLHDAHLDTIKRLVLAAECKDDNTADHVIRVGRYSALIAKKLGLSDKVVKNICYAAPMHDIGKIGIPKQILLKPGKLTPQEFELMKTHTTIGAKILRNPQSDILRAAHDIALSHHEKFNGKGYPKALVGDKIPVEARIVALVDAFDTIVSERPYKKAVPSEKAFDIIRKERGEHFDPDLVDVFMENTADILEIKKVFSCDEETLWDEFESWM
ncbi:cyclic nucleotide-binding domain-containing protein [Desulfobacterales bacterium HSG2]|nr:cyclic nucleotide-binding domain-containing protein [Desulfobacterales bacterium HSG2]